MQSTQDTCQSELPIIQIIVTKLKRNRFMPKIQINQQKITNRVLVIQQQVQSRSIRLNFPNFRLKLTHLQIFASLVLNLRNQKAIIRER